MGQDLVTFTYKIPDKIWEQIRDDLDRYNNIRDWQYQFMKRINDIDDTLLDDTNTMQDKMNQIKSIYDEMAEEETRRNKNG